MPDFKVTAERWWQHPLTREVFYLVICTGGGLVQECKFPATQFDSDFTFEHARIEALHAIANEYSVAIEDANR